MHDIDELFQALRRSRFRQRFCLRGPELAYLRRRGLDAAVKHARQFVHHRLAPAKTRNDGKQTPMRGHPAFIAQHATATCCRSCLSRWHAISKGRELTDNQIDHVITVIRRWLTEQTNPASLAPRHGTVSHRQTARDSGHHPAGESSGVVGTTSAKWSAALN